MTSNRAGAGPAYTLVDAQDPTSPWTDFQKVMDRMFDLLEGAHQDDGPPAPTRPPATPADGAAPSDDAADEGTPRTRGRRVAAFALSARQDALRRHRRW